MNQVLAVFNLGISGFYAVSILWHMIHPGHNVGYTRMLMFICLSTIPMVFMLAMIGGRDRWPMLIQMGRDLSGQGCLAWLSMLGLLVVMVIMPLGFLFGIWFAMGLRFGLLFLLYFIPLFIRLFTTSARVSTQMAVTQALLYFGSMFIGLGLVAVLEKFPNVVEPYTRHLQEIWPNYGSAAAVFFSVCVFGLSNQIMEARQALLALFGK